MEITIEEHKQRLLYLQNKNGFIDYKTLLKYSPETYYFLTSESNKRSTAQKRISAWDFASSLVPNAVIKADRKTPDYYAQTLIDCNNKYGFLNINNLMQDYPSTLNYIVHQCKKLEKEKKEKVSMWDFSELLVNKLFPNEKLNIQRRLTKAEHIENIKKVQNKYGYIDAEVMKKECVQTFFYLSKQAAKYKKESESKKSMWEIASLLVAPFEIKIETKRKYDTYEKIFSELSNFADENGCVDRFWENGSLYNAILRAAEKKNMHYSLWISKYSPEFSDKIYYVRYIMHTENYVENIKKSLESIYGEGGDCHGLTKDNPLLYGRVQRARRYHPDGMKKSVGQFIRELGLEYSAGNVKESKITDEYTVQLLNENYPEKVVRNIYSNNKVVYAVDIICAKMGIDMDTYFKTRGFTYVREKNSVKQKKLLKMKNNNLIILEDE